MIVGGQQTFDLSSLDGLRTWRDWVIEHQRELGCSGGCPIVCFGLAETDPEARARVSDGFKRWEAAIPERP